MPVTTSLASTPHLPRTGGLWETWLVTARLADRLTAARHRAFVGRRAEFALFDAMLADREPPPPAWRTDPGWRSACCAPSGWATARNSLPPRAS
ncbi:MAG: hypothetical protein ACRDSL_00845 [Pseudonocardiaceae bacterium]